MISRTASIFCMLILISFCATTAAHEVRPAYLHIAQATSDPQIFSILWKQPVVQNQRLAIDPVFPSDCQLDEVSPPEVTASALIHQWRTRCDLLQGAIHISGLTRTLTDVLVRIDHADGSIDTHMLRANAPTLDLQQASATTWSYLWIGVEHLVFGIDHVLFVIGIFLLVRQPVPLIKTITAFTVAHSITLVLSVFNVVRLEQGPVEAIIALSILFLARELLQEDSRRSALTRTAPWIMAFVFGLLHGLGFAGALADIGLPDDTLWLALLLFNVGIELGQLFVIGILALLMVLLNRWQQQTQVLRGITYFMGTLAAFWTIDRTLVLF